MPGKMGGKGIDMEALSPRDANALPQRANELKTKAAAQLRSSKEKEHPPPPPPNVTEPPSSDRRDGAVYQVGKLLGKGGFAVCYEGTLASARKKYALKIVKSQMPSKMEQKFQTELQIHSKMQQQNIVQFFRAFSFENCTYLVLELCPNGSLMDMVKKRKGLTEPETRFYAVQIAGAIKYMHSKGIIHRDLKMGNIFLDKHMNAKIGDFGLAALLVTGKDMHTIRRTTLCGTPNYIAPEILEKGKGGHDHMVDIWSLGVIMFAMLTSKPPFQSSTTDEIYRRARERDYEWPAFETTQKLISQEAKDLVATMLEEPEKRPSPDEIVQDLFFTSGYVPRPADITSKLREAPPASDVFYGVAEDAKTRAINTQHLKDMCRECGVGPWMESRAAHRATWREMAAEEAAGLTPNIPLADGIVYRPFDEYVREKQLLARYAASNNAQMTLEKSEDLCGTSSTLKPPSGLLRAPPQSFAAQQRAQNKPANLATATRPQQAPESAPSRSGSVRSRSKKEVLPTLGSLTNGMSVESCEKASKGTTRSLRTHLPSSRSYPSAAKKDVAPPQPAPPAESKPRQARPREDDDNTATLFSPSEYQEEVPGTEPDVVLERLQKLQSELERALNARSMAYVSTKEKTPAPPSVVVKWVDYTNKFGLGYILNDGSIGCILRNIPINDGPSSASKPATMLPPACILIHDAERHIQRKNDPKYRDRHEIVPMAEGIYFYENNGEDGLSRVRVDPQSFRVPMNPDGTPGKITVGKDKYDHRKRERVVLWKKFANYMMAYGREIDAAAAAAAEESPIRMPTIRDPSAAPSDVVTFCQRFGDVGCWVFCDGHLQFNFPDHTKIVLDATGTWCHFWHLPQEAAEKLAKTGSLEEAALDDRTVLSYPLQTLLNFGAASKTARSAASASAAAASRRRPEIPVGLQGIPAANDFRHKIEFVRDVVREWVGNRGIGNSDLSREARLRWTGARETKNVSIPQKHVWVTIGARAGDERLAAYFDPRTPTEMGPDIDESKKKE